MENNSRKRKPGGGRKKGEKTIVIRIPEKLLPEINRIIEKHRTAEPAIANPVTEIAEPAIANPVTRKTVFSDLYTDGKNTWSGRGRKPSWVLNLLTRIPFDKFEAHYTNPNPCNPITPRHLQSLQASTLIADSLRP